MTWAVAFVTNRKRGKAHVVRMVFDSPRARCNSRTYLKPKTLSATELEELRSRDLVCKICEERS
jgi:hypothetical protein